MSKAKISLLGFYQWDDTLFDQLSLPEGIDTQTVIDNILMKSADFEVVYSDFEFNQNMIGLISRKWQRTFQKWYDALQISYDPLYNYDRYEKWTDKGTDTGTVNREGTDTGTVGNVASSSDTSSSNGQTDTYVNTYDSDSLHQDGRSTSTQTASSSGNDSNTETRNLADSDKETRNLATSGEHDGHLYGNIGVTTSQQMLQSELDIAEWNLYEHITDIFIDELCIPVY